MSVRAKPTRRQRLAEEFYRFFWMFLYLWVVLGLFVLEERVILGQRGINVAAQGFALINALVLAKVMLLAEFVQVRRLAPPRPLIYPIVLESVLVTVLFIAFHIVEKVVGGLLHGEDLAASVPAIGSGGLPRLACVAAILFVSMLPFFAFRAIARELGLARVRSMLFGTAPEAGSP